MDFQSAISLGIRCAQAKDFQAALSFFSTAHALRPDDLDAVLNMGAVLLDLGQFEKALPFAQQASCKLDTALANGNYALCLFRTGRFAESENLFRRVTAVNPKDAQMQYNLAFSQLAQGNYADGWKQIEWRKKRSTWGEPLAHCPTWLGQALPDCQTLVVFHEQGLGDTLMLSRYLSLVRERVANVVVICPPALHRIIQSSFPVQVRTAIDPIAANFQCSFFDLPAIFGISTSNIPKMPYLNDPSTGVELRLPDVSRKIGLVWAGGPHAGLTDLRRSIDFDLLKPLFDIADTQFVSLQLGKTNSHPRLYDCSNRITDFADTAAIIQGLDLIITVDTSVVHLSAGLGKPTWLMNRYDSCWRWLLAGTWYRLRELREFRQTTPGDWTSVIKRVCAELAV